MAKQLSVNLSFNADTSQAKRNIEDLANSIKKISTMPPALFDDDDLKDAVQAAQQLEKHLSKAYNVNTGNLDLSKFSKSLSNAGQNLNYFQKNLSKLGVEGEKAFLNLAKSIATAETPTMQLNNHINQMWTELKKTARWQISSSVIHGFMGAVQTAYGYAKDLNESLNNIRIVTGYNVDEMADFADKANRAAKALSTTTTEYTNASLIYYQQGGMSDEEIAERTEVTIKMANAAGKTAETVSDQLTAVWNNFYDGSKSLEYYADVLTALGAATASSTDEIVEGVQKFAAVADTVGLSYEYAASALATVTATTRESADIVGTAFKTLFARIQGLQLGETLDDGTNLNKYSQALNTVGISIFETNGEIKAMDSILNELGDKWKMLAQDQKTALAQTVAGVRQYTQLIALMDNWDFFQQNLVVSYESEGTLSEQAEIYAESWEASSDRVRAAAEGIYDELIDEEFFITFNDNLTLLLTGVEGLVKGFGGMEGIISTVGGLFLKHFAKEAPEAIARLTDNFKVLTGRAQKDMIALQQENAKTLQDYSSNLTGRENEFEAEKQGLIAVGKMKAELAQNSKNMTQAEIDEANAKIEHTARIYDQIKALGRLYDEKKKEAKDTEQNYSDSTVRYVQDIILQSAKAKRQVDELQQQLDRLNQGDFSTNSGLEGLIDDIDIVEAQLKQAEEQSAKFKNAIAEIENSADISGPFKILLKNQNELSSKSSTWSKETKEAFNQLRQKTKEYTDQFKTLIQQRSNLNKLSESIENQSNSWKNMDGNIDKAKESLREWLNNTKKIIDSDSSEFKIEVDSTTLIDLETALEDSKIGFEDLKKKALEFLEVLRKTNSIGLENVNNEIDELYQSLIELQGGTEKAKKSVNGMEHSFEEAAQTGTDFESSMDGADEKLEELGNHTIKTSELITSFTGDVMELNGVLNSVRSISDIFSDEEASGIEKTGATIGGIVEGLFAAISVYQTLNKVSSSYIKTKGEEAVAHAKAAGAILSDADAVKVATKAVQGFKIGLGVISIVITAITALIGAYTASLEKNTERLKENVEESKKKVENEKEQINSNRQIIKSMTETLKAYEKGQASKEEMDSITRDLAEAYAVEGSAIAKLSGQYEDYQKVLEKATEKQEKELLNQLQNNKEYLNDQKTLILNSSKEDLLDNKFQLGDKNYINFYGYDNIFNSLFNPNSSEKKAKRALLNNVSEAQKYFNNNGQVLTSEGIIIESDQTIEGIIKTYDQLVLAREEMLKTMDDTERSASGIFKMVDEYVKNMTPQIEEYRKTLEEIKTLEIQTSVLNGSNINNYSDYKNWIKEIREELEKAGYEGEKADKILEAIISSSTNSNLSNYSTIYSALEEIKEAGTNLTNETLENLWTKAAEGNEIWDTLTLSSIDWKNATEENIDILIAQTQNYYNLLKEINELQSTKEGAQNIINALGTEGLNLKNREDILSAIDWGNADKGIISFNDFSRKTAEEQIEYIESLYKNSSKLSLFYSKELIAILQNEVNTANNIIKKYTQDSINEYEKVYQAVNILKDLREKYKTDGLIDNTILSNFHKDLEPYKEQLKEAFGDKYVNIVDPKKIIKFGDEAFENLLQSTTSAIKGYEEFINATEEAQNKTQKWQEIEQKIELELQLHPELYLDELQDDLDKIGKEIQFKVDSEEYENIEEKINKFIERDKIIEIGIQINNENKIQELEEKIESMSNVANKIGDDFIIAANDVQEFLKTFPKTESAALQTYKNILDGHTVLSDGTIQLNKNVAQAFIEAKKQEVDAAYQEIEEKRQLEINYTKDKIEQLTIMLNSIKGLNEKEVDSEEVKAKYKSDYSNAFAKLTEINNQAIEALDKELNSSQQEGISDVQDDALKAYRNAREAGQSTYVDLAKASADSINTQIFNYGQLTKAFLAASEGKIGELMGLRNSAQAISLYDLKDTKANYENLGPNVADSNDSKVGSGEKTQNVGVTTIEDLLESQEYRNEEEQRLEKEIELLNQTLKAEEDALSGTKVEREAANKQFDSIIAGLGSDGEKKTSKGDKDKYTPPDKSDVELEKVDVYKNINDLLEYRNDLLEEQEDIINGIDEEEDPEGKKQALKKQLELIDSVNEALKEKQKIAEQELETINAQAKSLGLIFNTETGRISNLGELVQPINDEIYRLEKIIPQSQEEEENIEKQIKVLERQKKELEDIDEAQNDTINILREIKNTLSGNENLTSSTSGEIISIDEDAAERAKEEQEKKAKELAEKQAENYKNLTQTLDFEININEKDLQKLDYYLGKIEDDLYSMAEAMELTSQKQPLITNMLEAYESFYNGLESKYAAGDISYEDYLAGLNQAYDGIYDQLEALQDLDEEMQAYYGETLAMAQEEVDSYTSRLEHLTSVLEHYKNIVELVNGEYDFDRIGTILDGQIQTVKNEMDAAEAWYQTVLAEQQAIEAQLAATSDPEQRAWLEKAYEDIYKTVDEAHENLLSKTEEFAQAVRAKLENEMAEAAHNMEMIMTDGIGFDLLNSSMDRVNSYQEEYLTKTNQIYETQKLMRTAQQAADKTDNAAAKARIKSFIDETSQLQNKNKLSKLELEIQQAQYDLLLAQIALEDAQNAKSTVRLQRDSTGNFGYVYTADQEQIANAEQGVLDAEQNLYNISLEAANNYGQKRIELQQQLAEDLIALEELHTQGFFETEQAYYEAREQLISEYEQLFIVYEDQYNLALETDQQLRAEIVDRGNKWRLDSEEQMTLDVLTQTGLQQEAWIKAYDKILEKTKVWREGSDQQYDLAAMDADNWKNAITMYTAQCEQAYIQFQSIVSSQSSIINKVLGDTSTATKDITDKSDELKDELINEVVPAVQSELESVRSLTQEYSAQRGEIQSLISYYEQLAQKIRDAITAAQQMSAVGNVGGGLGTGSAPILPGTSSGNNPGAGGGGPSGIGGGSPSGGGNSVPQYNNNANIMDVAIKTWNGNYGYMTAPERYQIYASQGYDPNTVQGVVNWLGQNYYDQLANGSIWRYDYDDLWQGYLGLDTGGYTGQWGPEGRLALLHQKELVLNDSDTSNFLAATGILRDISKLIDLESIANRLTGVSNIWTGSLGGANTLEQMVQIEAHFPNATDRNEIEEAFSNLLNTASQYANRK